MKTKCLDHGYVELIETWGSDERIIESARMSTNKGFIGWAKSVCTKCHNEFEVSNDFAVSYAKNPGLWDMPCENCGGETKIQTGDEKLLRYLYENAHSTPFEFAGMMIEVKAPILVFRQWHRHRIFSVNEMSARYAPLPDEDYLPSVERMMEEAGRNKQVGAASGSMALTTQNASRFHEALKDMYAEAQRLYEVALESGVPKELARVHLPVARYSRMRASANLRNWLGFLTLRMDAHAQYEIRVYADVVGKLIAEAFPRTWSLFKESLR